MTTSALAGFLLSGFLLSLVPALLPLWGYDISGDFAVAGRHFAAMVAGLALSASVVGRLPRGVDTRTLLVSGCGAAVIGLSALALAPTGLPWRFAGIFVVGIAAGLLHSGIFKAIWPAYETSPARTLAIGGVFFGAGSIACALLMSGVFWSLPAQTILLMLAAMPAVFGVLYATREYPAAGIVSHPEVLKQFRSGLAIVFSLLLFFQFANEWAIAGWLPVFLIHRLGVSPAAALKFLAAYFAALTLGRMGVSALLPRASHWRILAISGAASLFGCVMLALTDNRFGAGISLIFIGTGFAAIYPLVAAWIGRRFPYYHPGFFNGIFSLALLGGMLSPWLLGEIAGRAGLWVVTTLPAIGTCMVLVLLSLIWIHGRVNAE